MIVDADVVPGKVEGSEEVIASDVNDTDVGVNVLVLEDIDVEVDIILVIVDADVGNIVGSE